MLRSFSLYVTFRVSGFNTVLTVFKMHCIFSYDLQLEAGQRRQEIENQIEGILQQYTPNVRRLSTFFIIHLRNQAEWDTLLDRLSRLSRGIPETFYFILSPIMDGGRYNGILPRGEWDGINAITSLQD